MLSTIATIFISVLLSVGSVLGINATQPSAEQTFSAYNPGAGGTYRLRTSAGYADTSIQLSSFKEPISNLPITMAGMNTDIAYGTLDPQLPTKKELISFTGITQNAAGTAVLTGVTRGLSFSYPFTASTTLRQTHSGQSIFILSDAPQVFAEYAAKRNNENIQGQWTFYSTTSPKYFYNPGSVAWTALASTTLASKGYVDDTVTAGCADANTTTKGCVEIATQTEAASSTANGGTGAILVYGNGMATDTPQTATRATRILMSDMTGYLKQGWINLTEHFIFTSLFATSASSTNATTTNMSITGVLSSLLKTDSQGNVQAAVAGTDYGRQKYTFSTTTNLAVNNGYATSTLFGAIPSGAITASSTIEVHGGARGVDSGANGSCAIYLRDATGATIMTGTLTSPEIDQTYDGGFAGQVLMDGSASSQRYFVQAWSMTSGIINANPGGTNSNSEGTAAFALGSGISLYTVLQSTTPGVTCTLFNVNIVVNP